MTTGLVYSDAFLDHRTGPRHPERPERLRAIVANLQADGVLDRLTRLPFDGADVSIIARLHARDYIDRVISTCEALSSDEVGFIDSPDSAICRESAAIAQLAVGGAIAAVDAVMRGDVQNAFCPMRPPGHHAELDRSMGFCLFNNIALAAEHLVVEHDLQRIAIIDFDVHHGNGTQHLFESRSDVLFISIHEDPRYLYPGTGFAHERSTGKGEGFTLNIPLESGGGDEVYARVMDEAVAPRVREYEPQFILASAGFDAAAADPLARMEVTPAGFARITQRIVDLAEECCNNRLVSLLEGGYDLDSLAESVSRHVAVMMRAE